MRNLVKAVFELERSQDFETVARLVEALRQALQAPGHNELQRTLNQWLHEQIRRKAPAEIKPDVVDALARIPDLIALFEPSDSSQ